MAFDHVKFGAVLTGATTAREAATAARRIQDAGFDGVWVTDRVDGADTLELLAAVTSACDLDIGTGVLLLPQRHPTHVARSAATLDNLSDGRLTLGVGVGGERRRDFDAYGMSAKGRGVMRPCDARRATATAGCPTSSAPTRSLRASSAWRATARPKDATRAPC